MSLRLEDFGGLLHALNDIGKRLLDATLIHTFVATSRLLALYLVLMNLLQLVCGLLLSEIGTAIFGTDLAESQLLSPSLMPSPSSLSLCVVLRLWLLTVIFRFRITIFLGVLFSFRCLLFLRFGILFGSYGLTFFYCFTLSITLLSLLFHCLIATLFTFFFLPLFVFDLPSGLFLFLITLFLALSTLFTFSFTISL